MSHLPIRQITSWDVAEQNAADWMRQWGYRNVKLSSGGADGGVDVHAANAIAQVKFEAKQVGRPQLQSLVGARGRDHNKELLFFTGAGYSSQAIEYAADMGIALFVYKLDGTMSPQNRAAREVARRPGIEASPAGLRSEFRSAFSVNQRRVVAVIVMLVGLLLVQFFVRGIFDPENRSAGLGPWAAAVMAFLLGLLLLRAGWHWLQSTFANSTSKHSSATNPQGVLPTDDRPKS